MHFSKCLSLAYFKISLLKLIENCCLMECGIERNISITAAVNINQFLSSNIKCVQVEVLNMGGSDTLALIQNNILIQHRCY